jgi:hypothetical protein
MEAIMRSVAAFFLLAVISGTAFSQSSNESQMRKLTALLDGIRLEQQSVYQQFQMTETLQRSELRAIGTVPGIEVQEGSPPSYDDAARAKRDRQNRLNYYADEMKRLSGRYRELANESASVVEQMRTLATTER